MGMEGIPVQVIRSRKRTISVQIKPDGSVVVRAPLSMTDRRVEGFLREKEGWIRKTREKVLAFRREEGNVTKLTQEELQALTKKAKEVIPERVRPEGTSFADERFDGRVTIRHQRTRWGSCSSKGNLNFNCLLLLAPQEALDEVVVHELCHRLHPVHSRAFYDEMRRVYPDYARWRKWLRDHGGGLIARLPDAE